MDIACAAGLPLLCLQVYTDSILIQGVSQGELQLWQGISRHLLGLILRVTKSKKVTSVILLMWFQILKPSRSNGSNMLRGYIQIFCNGVIYLKLLSVGCMSANYSLNVSCNPHIPHKHNVPFQQK